MQGCMEGEESGHDQKTTEICGNEPEISSRFRRGKDMARRGGWFKRWRNEDGSGEEQDGEWPGSTTLGRMRDLWGRRPMRGRQWDVAGGYPTKQVCRTASSNRSA